jgi:hypothetical protein
MNMYQRSATSLSGKTVGPSPWLNVPPQGLGCPTPTFSLTSCQPGDEVVVGSDPVTVARRSVERSWRGVMDASSLMTR